MALSYVAYPSDGVSLQYDIPFQYLSRNHIFVFVENILVGYKWISPTRIELLALPEEDQVVRIQRLTERSARMTDYVDGQTLLAQDLNVGDAQNFFIMQELLDQIADGVIAGAIPVLDNGGGYISEQWLSSQLEANIAGSESLTFLLEQINAETQARMDAVAAEQQARLEAIAAEASARASGLADEAMARAAAVQAVADDLQVEVDQRLADVSQITASLNAEITNRVNAIQTLSDTLTSQINAEAATRATEVAGIVSDLNDEIATRQAEVAQVSQDLLDEVSARQAEVAQVAQDLLNEVSNRQAAVSGVAQDLVDEANTRQAEVAQLADDLTAEALSRTDADSALAADIVSEQQARIDDVTAITSQITALVSRVGDAESLIASEQTARADADSALANDITLLQGRVGDAESAIVAEQNARSTADTALSNSLTALTTRVGDAETAILNEQTARADADTAIANDVSALTTRVGDAEAGIVSEQTARATADQAIADDVNALTTRVGDAEAGIVSEQTARATADQAIADDVTALTTRVGDAEADILQEQQARSDADSAIASDVAALTTRMDGNEAAVASETQARVDGDNALSGQITTLTGRVSDAEADIVSEQQARASADQAIANDVTALTTRVGDAEADILQEQAARTNADAAIASDVSGLTTRMGDAESAIVQEQTARSNADAAIATDVAGLTTRMGDAEADIVSEQQARASADQAIANDVTALTTRMGDAEAGILQEQTARSAADAAIASDVAGLTTRMGDAESAIVQEQTARSDADQAIASDVAGLTTRMGDAEAGILSEQTARANADQAIADDVTALTTRTGDAEANIVSVDQARVDGDNALTQSIQAANSRIDDAEAAITQEAQTRATNEAATAQTIQDLSVTVGENANTGLVFTRMTTDSSQIDAPGVLSSVTNITDAPLYGLGGYVQLKSVSSTAPATSGATNGVAIEIPTKIAMNFQNRKVKITVNYAVPTTDGSSEFLLAYSTNDNGNSGAMSSGPLVSAGADPSSAVFYYDVPRAKNGGTDWIGIWPDASFTGKAINLLSITVEPAAAAEDIPEIAAVEAGITTLQSVKADKTALEAEALRITTLESGLTQANLDIAARATITALEQVENDAESARGLLYTTITSEWQAADASINSTISSLSQTVSDNYSANATRMDQIESNLTTAENSLNASITSLSQTTTDALALKADVTVTDALGVRIDDADAAILSEQNARISGDNALTTSLNALGVRMDGAEAGIISEQTARINADNALAGDISALTTRMGDAEADIVQEQTARANADQAIADDVTALTTRMGDAEADIVQVNQAVSDETSARVQSDDLLRGAIYGGREDVIPDPQYADTDFWNFPSGISGADANAAWTFPRVIAFGSSGNFDFSSEFFPVEPGVAYRIKTRIWVGSGFSGSFQPLIHMPSVAWFSLKHGQSVVQQNVNDPNAAIITDGDTGDLEWVWTNPEQAANGSIPRKWQFRFRGNFTGGGVAVAVQITRLPHASEIYSLDSRVGAVESGKASLTVTDAISARVDDNESAITNEANARANADTVITNNLNALTGRVGDAEADIIQEQTARANADNAIAQDVSLLTGRVDDNEAAIVEANTARANGDQAITESLNSLRASYETSEAVRVNPNWANGDLSPRIIMISGGHRCAAYEDGTEIYVNGVLDQTLNAGGFGSINVSIGDLVWASKPFSCVADGGMAAPPMCIAAHDFGTHFTRDYPAEFFVYPVGGPSEVSVWIDKTADQTPDYTFSVPQGAVTTWTDPVTRTGGIDFVLRATGSPVVLAKQGGTTGYDRTLVFPADTHVYHHNTAATGASRVEVFSGTGYPTNVPGVAIGDNIFGMYFAGDGAGGDANAGVPLAALGDTYCSPFDLLEDYQLTCPYDCVIKVYDFNNNEVASHTVSGASIEAPVRIQQGNASGAANNGNLGWTAGPYYFRGTKPFYFRSNVPSTQREYSGVGYLASARADMEPMYQQAAKNEAQVAVLAQAVADAETALASINTTVATLNSQVTQTQAALDTLEGAAALYNVIVEASGSNPAIIELLTGEGGSAARLAADTVTLTNTGTGGTTVDALTAVNGIIKILNQLTLGANDEIVLDPSNPAIEFRAGTGKAVLGSNFGANNNLLLWAGPDMPVSSMTKANATFWIDTSGAGYFGGALNAGTLQSSAQTSALNVGASATVGPFGSNGGQIVVTYSSTFERRIYGYGTPPSDPNDEAQVYLYRTQGTGSEALVQSQTIQMNHAVSYLPGYGNYDWLVTQSYSGSWTYTDNANSEDDRIFCVYLASRDETVTGSEVTNRSTRHSVVCVEE